MNSVLNDTKASSNLDVQAHKRILSMFQPSVLNLFKKRTNNMLVSPNVDRAKRKEINQITKANLRWNCCTVR